MSSFANHPSGLSITCPNNFTPFSNNESLGLESFWASGHSLSAERRKNSSYYASWKKLILLWHFLIFSQSMLIIKFVIWMIIKSPSHQTSDHYRSHWRSSMLRWSHLNFSKQKKYLNWIWGFSSTIYVGNRCFLFSSFLLLTFIAFWKLHLWKLRVRRKNKG